MRFSIITPSFRSSKWLRLCIPSVADQGVELEHLVQDSCSDDATRDWLPGDRRVQAFIEKDRGMYDAVNRGLVRAKGEILAYLNCDEQYLPGALTAVDKFFERNPAVEVAFADAVITDDQGDYLCHRRALIPNRYHSQVSGNLSILTAATFFRRSLIENRRLLFNQDMRVLGDAEWLARLIESRVRMGLIEQLTTAFTDTGENLSFTDSARREVLQMRAAAPAIARAGRGVVILHHRLRRLMAGHYRREAPFDYSIYTLNSPGRRITKQALHPTFRWRR